MPQQVLLVAQNDRRLNVETQIVEELRPKFDLEHRSLRSLLTGIEQATAPAVIVATISFNVEHASAFLHSLHKVAAQVLAVFPEGTSPEQLADSANLVDDFVLLPTHHGELEQRVRRLMWRADSAPGAVVDRLLDEFGAKRLVGDDPDFLRIVDKMRIAARAGAPVLITGETGTGKELSARAIHHFSSRRAFPFIAVDCGALPLHLVENELFGHVRGAFTDAHADQKGLVTLAAKGTLFLDEVDALPIVTQAKLLRFMQERTYRPLGSERFLEADVNVLAASNRDLKECVASKEFRQDLYYRLNVFHICLPPLRERRSDIPILARHFLASLGSHNYGVPPKILAYEALRKLEGFDWPGNVRELFNVIQQAAAYAASNKITAEEIILPARNERVKIWGQNPTDHITFRYGRTQAVAAFEKNFIQGLLRKHSGNVTRAALDAAKDRRSFSRLMKKYKIARDSPPL